MYLLEWRQIPDKCWIGCFCELSFVGDFVAGMLNFKGFKIEIPQEMLPWDTPFQKWYGYSCHFPTSLSSKWWDLKHVTYGQRPPKTPSLISMSYCWWKKTATSTGCLLVWGFFSGWPNLICFCQVVSWLQHTSIQKMISTGKKQPLRNDLLFFLIFFLGRISGDQIVIFCLELGTQGN